MKKIIFATSNEGKMKEIRMILDGCGCEVLSLKEAGIRVDIEENGTTFEENAVIKVKAIRPLTDAIVLADDSGLEVDWLGKAPGVYSARYMGEDTSYEIKNQAIIDQLEGVEGADRSARFVCVIAASLPDGSILTTRGTIEGEIAKTPAGAGGFGYDPIVYVPEFGMTTAELSAEAKNEVSHRGKGLRAMKAKLAENGWI
ncbi:MAG: XTP/dITP diphosphatase [Lachnospiraceae bacterium]|nr:XTP/dITP diphosphatase [Lachnospiraceae bacterium]